MNQDVLMCHYLARYFLPNASEQEVKELTQELAMTAIRFEHRDVDLATHRVDPNAHQRGAPLIPDPNQTAPS